MHAYERGRSDPAATRPGQPHRVAYKQHDAPDEVLAFTDKSEYKAYRELRELTDLREPYQFSCLPQTHVALANQLRSCL